MLQSDVLELRRSLEAELGIPPELDVQVVAHCFLQYLYELPEPLLGYDLYGALQSCSEIENPAHRIRNLSLLLDEVPDYNLYVTCSNMLIIIIMQTDIGASYGFTAYADAASLCE